MKTLFKLLTLVAVLLTQPLQAAVPMLFNYQGTINDISGYPLDGNGYFKFALMNQTGNSAYWANDGTTLDGSEPTTSITIPVTNGVFAVKLGDTALANMAALNQTTFNNSELYLRVWFSFDGINFELFSPDAQIVSNVFSIKAQVADEVLGNSVTSSTIANNSITDEDINSGAQISASKIDTLGLDADTLDGNDSSDFATTSHTHNYAGSISVGGPAIDLSCTSCVSSTEINSANLDSDTLDGNDSSAFALTTHTHTNDGDWNVVGNNVYSLVSGNVGIGDTTPTSKLDVNGTIAASAFQYRSAQTRYLQLAGGQCSRPNGIGTGFSNDVLYCDMSDGSNTAPGYWSVNLPNGSIIRGMRMHVYASAGGVTTCNLRYGVQNQGALVASVSSTISSQWHTTSETLLNHTVDTENNAYGVDCNNTTPGSGGVGSIRIRYTVITPD